MSSQPIRVLGVDTSLRCSGLAVVSAMGNRLTALDYGVVKNPASWPHSKCLRHIHEEVTRYVQEHQPDMVAIEGIFHCKNVRTAVTLGQARGVVIAACAVADLPVYEYAPRKVKQAIVGSGAAQKEQVARMVVKLLHLPDVPQEDAADALSIAICHIHARSSLAALAPTAL